LSFDLPARILAGIEALREGRPAEAAEALRQVAEDRDFAAAEDLPDVRARVFSLLAQALLEADRPREAEPWARRALSATEALGDEQGALQIRALHQRIFAAATDALRAEQAARQAATLAATPLEEVLAGLDTDAARAPALVAKANAEVDAGRAESGAEIARAALRAARAAEILREEVLARLTLARALPAEAEVHLQAAWARAEAADEFNLVGAVARAAELAGVKLGVLEGPTLPERESP